MPKSGLSDAQWKQRMGLYAHGKFKFGQGQGPIKGTKWFGIRIAIDNCPKFKSGKDLFGNKTKCTCKYHDAPSVPAVPNTVPTPEAPVEPSVPPPSQVLPEPSSEPPARLSSGSAASTDDIPTTSEGSDTHLKRPVPSEKAPIPQLKTEGVDYSLRLPFGWQTAMAVADRHWVGKVLFVKKGALTTKLELWFTPPPIPAVGSQGVPKPEVYFLRRLFLWMPRLMWKIDLHCPHCTNPTQSLRSKGVYNRVRLVLDINDYYYMAAEYMDCNACKGTFIAWDSRILGQLQDGVRSRFPATLTYRYACDNTVVSMLRARTLGNSPTALQHNIQELHSNTWNQKVLMYLTACQRHKEGRSSLNAAEVTYEVLGPMSDVPQAKWFLACYIRDVYSRLDTLKASATSVYGTVLKIDSTKKITKKLQGAAAGSASWATSVGNEKGEIIQCVLTTSESMVSLKNMASGLVQRFQQAKEPPPAVLYTDRDCCELVSGRQSKLKMLFDGWPEIEVRMDIWHFMRRFTTACTTEAHPLYPTLMSGLSKAIFEWDSADLTLLHSAKRVELLKSGIPNPSVDAVRRSLTKQEMARHCKRKTRGTEETALQIENLLQSLWDATDALGVALFNDSIEDVWTEQKRHVRCIQDPPGVTLYTRLNWTTKGGVKLPVYRCARGSTSLESFHLHLNRFIPGTSASAVHFQAYLLEGISRWNSDRSKASIAASKDNNRSFDYRLHERLDHYSRSVLGESVVANFSPLGQYTGELLGIDYLREQSGESLIEASPNLEKDIDEGFSEDSSLEVEEQDVESVPLDDAPITLPEPDSATDSDDTEAESQEAQSEAVDGAGIPGWDKVDALADALIALQGLAVPNTDVNRIKAMYEHLDEYDKRALQFPARHKPAKGRFKRTKRSGHTGSEAVARCFLTGGQPAFRPSHSRLVEAICIKLCDQTTSHRKSLGPSEPYLSRWKLVVYKYNNLRQRVIHSPISDETRMQLFPINEATLSKWYKDRVRVEEVKNLLQGLDVPNAPQCATEPVPTASEQPLNPIPRDHVPLHHSEPEDRVGLAAVRNKPSSSTIPIAPKPSPSPCISGPLCQPSTSGVQKGVSRTTEWRQKQEAKKGLPIAKKPRATYTCRKCGLQPTKENNHSQYYGQQYCPLNNTQTMEEWRAEKRQDRETKKLTKNEQA